MNEFLRQYIATAFWSSIDEVDGEPLDKNHGIDDLAHETLAQMTADCAKFEADNAKDIQGRGKQAGHDFWLTRNGHGAGFGMGIGPKTLASDLQKLLMCLVESIFTSAMTAGFTLSCTRREAMKTIIENATALIAVPHEATDYRNAGVCVKRWARNLLSRQPKRFVIEFYVKGYRPTNDVWLYESRDFDGLAEALEFYEKAELLHGAALCEWLNFEPCTEGGHGLTLEYMKVFEYSPEGKFQWDRN